METIRTEQDAKIVRETEIEPREERSSGGGFLLAILAGVMLLGAAHGGCNVGRGGGHGGGFGHGSPVVHVGRR